MRAARSQRGAMMSCKQQIKNQNHIVPKRAYLHFAVSASTYGFDPTERQFIVSVLNKREDLKWFVTTEPLAADWHIALETQFYIDQRVPDCAIGQTYTYTKHRPFLTRISNEHWHQRPEPLEAFPDLWAYRMYLIVQQLCAIERKPFLRETKGANVLDVFGLNATKTDASYN